MDVKNLQSILSIKHTATAAYSAGDIVIIGSLVSYTRQAVASGDTDAELVVVGQGEVTKNAGEAWTIGQKIYWDSGNSEFTSTATGNSFAGIASDVAASAAVLGRVLFNSTTLNDPGPQAANVVALTDNSGGVDPGDTIAAITEAATMTDNSGGVDPGDDTIAVVTNQDTLTDSGAGTADDTVDNVADIALSTSDTYTDAAVNTAVNAAILTVRNNTKEWTEQQVKQVAANTAITAAIAQLAAKVNVNSLAIDSASDAVAGLIAKLNEEIAALKAAGLQASS
jgi:predicted RecA/RadA family phage recombinase